MVNGLEVWYLRKDGITFDTHTVYAIEHPEVFSVKLLLGGTFTPTPNRGYFEGKMQYLDLLDIEQFTIGIIHCIVKMLKYYLMEIIDNKVIEVFIEHCETTSESYYMPTFNEKLQIRELNNNVQVVNLDEELFVAPHTINEKFQGMPKCRKTLAIEWLTNDKVRQSSGLGGAENDVVGSENYIGDENDVSGYENDIKDNEDINDQNVEGVEDIVDDEHIIEQVKVNMEEFRFSIDLNKEKETVDDPLRPQLNIN
nr:transposase, MuDR [Tanacetum cinerariifolium]